MKMDDQEGILILSSDESYSVQENTSDENESENKEESELSTNESVDGLSDEEFALLLDTEEWGSALTPEPVGMRVLKRERLNSDSVEDGSSAKVMKVAEVQTEVPEGNNEFYYQRLHKLESERRDLVEKLLDTREKFLYTEHSLTQTTEGLSNIKEQRDSSLLELRRELAEVRAENDKLRNENSMMAYQLKDAESFDQMNTSIREGLEQTYQQQLSGLKQRLTELGDADVQLVSAQRTILLLRKKLQAIEEEGRIVSLSKKQVHEHGNLVCRNEVLQQENAALRQRVCNVELLQYQLQMEREKCTALEEKLQALDETKVENETLRAQLRESTGQEDSGASSSSVVVWRYKLLDVQQRELILTKRCGELETELRVAGTRNRDLEEKVTDLQKSLRMEKEEVRIRNDSIQRLERRLQFIAKERDGCVNVLNSYKLDGGADSVIKEQVKELQETVKRQERKILELEKQNESLEEAVDSERRRVVQMNEEVGGARSILEGLEEECRCLRMEKQKMEELLVKLKDKPLTVVVHEMD